MANITNNDDSNGFICPECEHTVSCKDVSRSMAPPTGKTLDPWQSVLQTSKCDKCKYTIPCHLAYGWGEKNIKDARIEWIKLYKKRSLQQP